jgi:hypothetical protein
MLIAVRFDELQQADDGDTTHYGGVVKVNGVEVRATGTDRDFNLQLDITKAIEDALGRPLTEKEADSLDENDDLLSLVDVDLTFE